MKKISAVLFVFFTCVFALIYSAHYLEKHKFDDPATPRPGIPTAVLQTTFLDVWVYQFKVKWLSDAPSMYELSQYYMWGKNDYQEYCRLLKMANDVQYEEAVREYKQTKEWVCERTKP